MPFVFFFFCLFAECEVCLVLINLFQFPCGDSSKLTSHLSITSPFCLTCYYTIHSEDFQFQLCIDAPNLCMGIQNAEYSVHQLDLDLSNSLQAADENSKGQGHSPSLSLSQIHIPSSPDNSVIAFPVAHFFLPVSPSLPSFIHSSISFIIIHHQILPLFALLLQLNISLLLLHKQFIPCASRPANLHKNSLQKCD